MRQLVQLFITYFMLVLPQQVMAGNAEWSKVELSAEYILRQELTLNQLIVNLHLLQIDFLNNEAREHIQDNLSLLDTTIPNLPTSSQDGETDGLLISTKALWPVISRHTSWMGNLPRQSRPPEATSLLLALAKLDRQLLLLRQKLMTLSPKQEPELRILEQALLMQRLSREYLSLTLNERKDNKTVSGRMQLQTLASHFEQRLIRLNSQYKEHPFAGIPIQQASATWNFISETISRFPVNPVPEMIALYSDRIVNRLTSVHQMF